MQITRLVLLMGYFIIGIGFYHLLTHLIFVAGSEAGVGTVVDIERSVDSEGHVSKNPIIKYITADGLTITQKASSAGLKSFSLNDVVNIRYNNKFNEKSLKIDSVVVNYLPVVFCFIFGYFFVYFCRKTIRTTERIIKKEKFVKERGTSVFGKIKLIIEDPHDQGRPFQIIAEGVLADGTRKTFESDILWGGVPSLLREGVTIEIKIHPENPDKYVFICEPFSKKVGLASYGAGEIVNASFINP